MSSSITSHFMRPARQFSNKENTSYAPAPSSSSSSSLPLPLSSAYTPRRHPRGMPAGPFASAAGPSASASAIAASTSAKPRVGGIGKAPKRSATGLRHGAKPYERATSVTRAKQRNVEQIKQVKQEVKSAMSLNLVPPPPAPAPTAVAGAGAGPAAPTVTITAPSLPPPSSRLLMRLPRPIIPAITHLPGHLAGVPPQYALLRLQRFLKPLLYIAGSYRPIFNDFPQDITTVPFGFPAILNGNTQLAERIKGQEPDVALCIIDKHNPGARRMVIPASAVVYATQCASWPPTAEARRDALAAEADAAKVEAAAAAAAATANASAQVKLEPIEEGDEDTTMRSVPSLSSSTSSFASTASTSVAGPSRLHVKAEPADMQPKLETKARLQPHVQVKVEAEDDAANIEMDLDIPDHTPFSRSPFPTPIVPGSEVGVHNNPDLPIGYIQSPYRDTYPPLPLGTVRLPIMQLVLPHVESFTTLHVHLHIPQQPLMPYLLKLPAHISYSTDPGMSEAMAAKTTKEILDILATVKGFWCNVCALGISAERTWAGMGESWASCVAELQRRGYREVPRDELRREAEQRRAAMAAAQ